METFGNGNIQTIINLTWLLPMLLVEIHRIIRFCHVIDVEEATQVAEYRGKLDTKDFGNFLVSLATDYNNFTCS